MRALRQLVGRPTPKNLDEIIRESIKLRSPFQHFATVIIDDQNIIKGISQSRPNNLILDNFGYWLSAMFRAPAEAVFDVVGMKDTGGNAETVRTYGPQAANASSFCNYKTGQVTGTYMQVGSGSTAAARDDVAIETAFGTAPEDAHFVTGSGSYAAAAVSVAGAITAGGNGTIAETGLIAKWLNASQVAKLFLLFHDILASTEAFTAGNTITVAYTINL